MQLIKNKNFLTAVLFTEFYFWKGYAVTTKKEKFSCPFLELRALSQAIEADEMPQHSASHHGMQWLL